MTAFPENASTRLEELLNRPANGKVITSDHRRVIATICDEARMSGVPVEHLIVAVKNVFDRLPALDGEEPARHELRARLVSVCIEEYYRDGDGRRDGDGLSR